MINGPQLVGATIGVYVNAGRCGLPGWPPFTYVHSLALSPPSRARMRMQYVFAGVKRSMWTPGRGQVSEPGLPFGWPQPTAQAAVSVNVELGRPLGGGTLSPKWLDQSQYPV